MNNELATTISSLTTTAKSIFDITNQLISNRQKNKLITRAETEWLRIAIEQSVTSAKLAARHGLAMDAYDRLWESYQRIQGHDVNGPYGMIALQILRNEAEAYASYLEYFDRTVGLLS